jgi:beta-galactosidase
VDRRKFIESLSGACLATQLKLTSKTMLLNSAVPSDPNVSVAAEQVRIVPIPASIPNIQNPVVNLAGTWQFAPIPPAEVWKPDFDLSKWHEIKVPCELAMEGFDISPDVEYPCRRTVQIPGDFAGHRIFVRFDGVYSRARVWVNGRSAGDHSGGFTSWDAEITDHVEPGASAQVVVGITDESNDISQGSYYAKHSIAGILRDVRVFAMPKTHLRDLAVTASFDGDRGGTISLKAALESPAGTDGWLRITLRDSTGTKAPTDPAAELALSRRIHCST